MDMPADADLLDDAALADLVELVGDDATGHASIARLARALFQEAVTLVALSTALDQRDANGLATLAHRLKGRAVALGCAALGRLAAEIESGVRTPVPPWAGIGELLAMLATVWRRSRGALAVRLAIDLDGTVE